MSKFTSTIVFDTDFDGDKVHVVMKRLTNAQAQQIVPFIKNDSGLKDQFDLLLVLKEILPKCVIALQGVTDGSGQELKLEQILEETYFSPLVLNIGGNLISGSFYKDEQKK